MPIFDINAGSLKKKNHNSNFNKICPQNFLYPETASCCFIPANALTLHPQTLCFYIHRPYAFTSTDLVLLHPRTLGFFLLLPTKAFYLFTGCKVQSTELSGGGGGGGS
jgi:hypothetical protein